MMSHVLEILRETSCRISPFLKGIQEFLKGDPAEPIYDPVDANSDLAAERG